jgi:hypothetical protein
MVSFDRVSKWLYLIAVVIVLFTCSVVGVQGLIKGGVLMRWIYVLVGVATIYLAVNRSIYLPFLGECAYPCSMMTEKTPEGATIELEVQVPPDSMVVYWASEHSDQLDIAPDPMTAYANYSNAGVVRADAKGSVVLKIREPTQYRVPLMGTLKKHVHYRYCKKMGLLSPIFTVYI